MRFLVEDTKGSGPADCLHCATDFSQSLESPAWDAEHLLKPELENEDGNSTGFSRTASAEPL